MKVLYFGHQNKQKGIAVLLEAMKLTKHKLTMVTPNKNEFEGDFNKVEGRVDIVKYIKEADVVVNPYISLNGTEANPLCIVESLACGKQVITSDLPELKELFDKEVIFVPVNDPKALADALNKVKVEYNEKGVKKAKEFDIHNVAKQHLKIYYELVNTGV